MFQILAAYITNFIWFNKFDKFDGVLAMIVGWLIGLTNSQ